ncbi:phosphopantothenoylcysteine decarboxylase, partial [Streptococcus anginosus]
NLHCDSSLVGKKGVITAGATLEKIDPVRYISNFSSGKMGWAMVQAFLQRGADVTLIYGKVSVNIVPFVRLTTIHVAS